MSILQQPPPPPRRRPRQARSRGLVRAIREAAESILREQGPEALTTNAIAERAGVGIASVYRYYPDKHSILGDLLDQQIEAIDRRYRATLDSGLLETLSLPEQIRYLIETPILISRELLALHGEFFRRHHLRYEISYRPGPGQHNWLEWSESWWPAQLARQREQLRVTDPGLAARVMLMSARGAIDAAIEREPALLEDPAFADELIEMACAYLLHAPEAGRSR